MNYFSENIIISVIKSFSDTISALTSERRCSWVQVDCVVVARYLLKAGIGAGSGDCGETQHQLVLCVGISVISDSGRLSWPWHQATDPPLLNYHRCTKLN